MIYVKLALELSGFTNQIFSLISGILLAIINGDKIVFVDYFLNDFSKKKYTKISEILNISMINDYLYLKYGIYCKKNLVEKIINGNNCIRTEFIFTQFEINFSEDNLNILLDKYWNKQYLESQPQMQSI